jgi:hypothetical protein
MQRLRLLSHICQRHRFLVTTDMVTLLLLYGVDPHRLQAQQSLAQVPTQLHLADIDGKAKSCAGSQRQSRTRASPATSRELDRIPFSCPQGHATVDCMLGRVVCLARALRSGARARG